MTEITDELNEKQHLSSHDLPNHESMDDESDFSDEGPSSAGDEAPEGELTPNDIFGLDPLDVLTLEELAEYLKVSTAAAHRVIKEQKLPGRNIGGEWRFLRDAVANWLRCQEAPVQQQQKAREDYSKAKDTAQGESEPERFSRPPQRPYQSEQSGGEYRPRQKFADDGQYGNQGGGQYGNRGGQYGGNQYGNSQSGGGQYGGGGGGGYSRPPRRPFRAADGDNSSETGYSGGQTGGYGSGASGTRYGNGGNTGGGYTAGGNSGGGYAGGGQRFGGGPKRKNKRQVFENERGKRLDRRKEGETPESAE